MSRRGEECTSLGQDIQASAAETRRHFEVIRLNEKAERFREEVRQEFSKVDRRFLHLDARIAVLERR